MANKKKNTKRSSENFKITNKITNTEKVTMLFKNFWIFLIPILFFMLVKSCYNNKQKDIEINNLENIISKQKDSINELKADKIVLTDQLNVTSFELKSLKNEVGNLYRQINQHTDYKNNVNKKLNELKSDLYKINVEINQIQKKLGRNQKKGRQP